MMQIKIWNGKSGNASYCDLPIGIFSGRFWANDKLMAWKSSNTRDVREQDLNIEYWDVGAIVEKVLSFAPPGPSLASCIVLLASFHPPTQHCNRNGKLFPFARPQTHKSRARDSLQKEKGGKETCSSITTDVFHALHDPVFKTIKTGVVEFLKNLHHRIEVSRNFFS